MSIAPPNGATPLHPESLDNAAQLLTAPGALMQLTLEEARIVASYMAERTIAADTTFIREGDAGDNGFMALLLDGEVVVESIVVSRTEPVTIKVLGPAAWWAKWAWWTRNRARPPAPPAPTWCAPF
jgi:hypothetical protein